ncbi:MAG: hypothetical protein QF733_01880 [Phycisphaerales bacterium]|nr:hypothetical protein [Phycisphaerales bacterium]
MVVMQVGMACVMCGFAAPDAGGVSPEDLAAQLNSHASVKAPPAETAWAALAPAIRALPAPPDTVEPLRQDSIWPGMADWDAVSAWAAAGGDLAEAITDAAQRPVFGIKYGVAAAAPEDAAAGLVVELGTEDDRLILPSFRYLDGVAEMAVWTVAETYRLAEAGKAQEGLTLLLDELMVLRRLADREFMDEKEAALTLLASGMHVFRDVTYRYMDDLSGAFLTHAALHDIPSLSPGRESLFMPEHDMRLCEALLQNSFDQSLGLPLADEFPAVFTEVQVAATNRPLQRFGARRRWESIYEGQDSLEANKARLQLIFDDWWRRWRSSDEDMMGRLILDQQSQFELMNIARFAAIDAVIHDMRNLFKARTRLQMEVNASATAAGLAAYRIERGLYPQTLRTAFGITMNKEWAKDGHATVSEGYRPWFRYRRLEAPADLDIGTARVEIPAGIGLLYSTGLDGVDGLATRHADERWQGDLIIWPPTEELLRGAEKPDAKATPPSR